MTRTYTRKKPTSAVRDKADPAAAATYEALTQACIESIITRPEDVQQGRQEVLISLPYFVKISKDFPQGILERKTATCNIYRAKAKSLLNWLYDNKHSQFSYSDVTRGALAFNRELLMLERQLNCENMLDTDLPTLYNESLTTKEKV